jgi:hypothetical protein
MAGAAAELTAELAVALAPHGSALLRTLASTGTPDGSTPNGCGNHHSYLVSRAAASDAVSSAGRPQPCDIRLRHRI